MQILHFYVRPGPPEKLWGGDESDPPKSGGGGKEEEEAADPPCAGGGFMEGGLGGRPPLRALKAVAPGLKALTVELCYNVEWGGMGDPSGLGGGGSVGVGGVEIEP